MLETSRGRGVVCEGRELCVLVNSLCGGAVDDVELLFHNSVLSGYEGEIWKKLRENRKLFITENFLDRYFDAIAAEIATVRDCVCTIDTDAISAKLARVFNRCARARQIIEHGDSQQDLLAALAFPSDEPTRNTDFAIEGSDLELARLVHTLVHTKPLAGHPLVDPCGLLQRAENLFQGLVSQRRDCASRVRPHPNRNSTRSLFQRQYA